MEMIAIGIGSNLGDRISYLREAKCQLANILQGMRCSSIYESPALLLPDSPKAWDQPFLNAVLVGQSDREPLALLRVLKEIESTLGRQKGERWAPRKIDLDLLFVGDRVMQTDDLTLPHKGIISRAFVVWPLLELLPNMVWPKDGSRTAGQTVKTIANHVKIQEHEDCKRTDIEL